MNMVENHAEQNEEELLREGKQSVHKAADPLFQAHSAA
jgi:hypothetical protein